MSDELVVLKKTKTLSVTIHEYPDYTPGDDQPRARRLQFLLPPENRKRAHAGNGFGAWLEAGLLSKVPALNSSRSA